MTKIYSNIKPGTLLHIIVNREDFTKGRKDVVSPSEFLQCAILTMPAGKTFMPHRHIWKEGPKNLIVQESWVILKGRVKCILYDLDDTILKEIILKAGEMSLTIQGGHNYQIMQDAEVIEFKNGPYLGQKLDKILI
jgi:hypothetical protein